MITYVLAQCTVNDPVSAERWYTTLFGRGPDARPMDGLIEWHPVDGNGLQVYCEPERSGRSTVVFGESDLDEAADRLAAGGLTRDRPQPGGPGRTLILADPDGNRVVLVGY
jgi:predicted enzyme related to lactoylglutathione lyase